MRTVPESGVQAGDLHPLRALLLLRVQEGLLEGVQEVPGRQAGGGLPQLAAGLNHPVLRES